MQKSVTTDVSHSMSHEYAHANAQHRQKHCPESPDLDGPGLVAPWESLKEEAVNRDKKLLGDIWADMRLGKMGRPLGCGALGASKIFSTVLRAAIALWRAVSELCAERNVASFR